MWYAGHATGGTAYMRAFDVSALFQLSHDYEHSIEYKQEYKKGKYLRNQCERSNYSTKNLMVGHNKIKKKNKSTFSFTCKIDRKQVQGNYSDRKPATKAMKNCIPASRDFSSNTFQT